MASCFRTIHSRWTCHTIQKSPDSSSAGDATGGRGTETSGKGGRDRVGYRLICVAGLHGRYVFIVYLLYFMELSINASYFYEGIRDRRSMCTTAEKPVIIQSFQNEDPCALPSSRYCVSFAILTYIHTYTFSRLHPSSFCISKFGLQTSPLLIIWFNVTLGKTRFWHTELKPLVFSHTFRHFLPKLRKVAFSCNLEAGLVITMLVWIRLTRIKGNWTEAEINLVKWRGMSKDKRASSGGRRCPRISLNLCCSKENELSGLLFGPNHCLPPHTHT